MREKDENKIIFIGNIVRNSICLESKSCSPAGNNWQKKFVENLEKVSGIKIINFSILPLQVFPFGNKILVNSFKNSNNNESILIKYLNIVFFKKLSIFFSIIFSTAKKIKSKEDLLIIYNLYTPMLLATIFLKTLFGIKISAIVADIVLENDLKYKGIKKILYNLEGNFQKYLLKKVDKIIAVNQMILKDFNIRDGIVLEGGVDQEKINIKNMKKNNDIKKIIFTGTLDNLNGIEFLLNSFIKCKSPNIELNIYGRGPQETLVREFSEKDNRIKYCGFVSQDKVMDILQGGDLLIIPRLKSIKTLRYTFPSKLFEYMKSGTPVLMTNIPGLGDDYKENVFMIDTEKSDELSLEIEKVLEKDYSQLKIKGIEAKKFIEENKNWEMQLKRVWKILEK